MKYRPFVGFILIALALGCENQKRPELSATEPKKADSPASPEPARTSSSKRIFPLADLATIGLQAPRGKIEAWVMDEGAKRQEGMMWLTDADVPKGKGMIFVFPDEADRSFWMANTLIPLDIAYLDSTGKVLNIMRGDPESDASLPSEGPSKYVVELRAGDAERLGLRKGSRIAIPPGLTSAD